MGIEDDIAQFERVPTLALLGRDPLRILAIGAENRYVHGGNALFRDGETADAGYVVQEGSFTLVSERNNGIPPLTVGAGTLLGELALITETTWRVTATAREPSTVMRIPRTLFLKMLEGYPDAANRLRQDILKRADASWRDIGKVRDVLIDVDAQKSE
jgi:CRP-like cAMP-binding protein